MKQRKGTALPDLKAQDSVIKRTASGRSRRSASVDPAASNPASATQQALPAQSGRSSSFTGRYIIVFLGHTTSEAVAALHARSGLSVASSSDFVDRVAVSPGTVGSAVYFESLGVAVADAPPDQLRGLGVSVANQLQIVPERYMYAAGLLHFERSYLEGYRAGVNAVLDGLLGGGTAQVGTSVTRTLAAAALEDEFTWNLTATGVSRSTRAGRGVKVAVLDTGCDLSHPDLAKRASLAKSFVPDSPVQDIFGHGTHCIGTAAGLAKPVSHGPRYGCASEAELLIGKVLGDDGHGDEGWLLNGINWALENKADIVSLSIEGPYDAASPVLPQYEAAGARALAAGRLIIAAAGNYSIRPLLTRPVASPACASTIMSVGALGPDNRVASFSCAGSPAGAVDLAAPGVSIESSFPTPRTRKVDSGTSMAAPLVAGIAALHMEAEPGLRGKPLWDKLITTATKLDDAEVDVGAGCVAAP